MYFCQTRSLWKVTQSCKGILKHGDKTVQFPLTYEPTKNLRSVSIFKDIHSRILQKYIMWFTGIGAKTIEISKGQWRRVFRVEWRRSECKLIEAQLTA